MAEIDLAGLSIETAMAYLADGRLSCEELATFTLNRIETCDRHLHAYVSVFSEQALKRAREMDRNGGSGAGLLTGLPVAIKDLFDYAGFPTRAGSRATLDRKANSTAFCVQKLEAAGANIIGKTHTVEFAFGGWGANTVMGTPWNPRDRKIHRVPGGSSSGSAVAVASGMAVAALGTDTGGSVRTPASFCGLVGSKTSPGLVSRQGVFPLCPTHDTVGTLTRSVRDAARVLQVISGPDPDDPVTLEAPKADFLSALDDGVDGLEIGILDDAVLAPASRDIFGLYQKSLGNLRRAGARIELHVLPQGLMHYLEDSGRIMSAESYASLGGLVAPDDSPVAPVIRDRVLAGRSITDDEYADMLGLRKRAQDSFLAGFGKFDALVTPTCPNTAIAVADVDESKIVTPFGRFVNYLDLAAVSVPMGLASDRLPAGLQIVVRKYDDALALRIARIIEKSMGR